MSATMQAIDQAKLDEFMGRFVGDLGAALSSTLVVIGDRLGLYRAMADGGPLTPAEFAAAHGTDERYVREWLINQAAGGYVSYDAATNATHSPPSTLALTEETSPAFIPGAFLLARRRQGRGEDRARLSALARGMDWGEHDPTSSPAPSGSSAPAMPPTWYRPGFRRSTACSRSSSAARRWPTSAAATAPRRS